MEGWYFIPPPPNGFPLRDSHGCKKGMACWSLVEANRMAVSLEGSGGGGLSGVPLACLGFFKTSGSFSGSVEEGESRTVACNALTRCK